MKKITFIVITSAALVFSANSLGAAKKPAKAKMENKQQSPPFEPVLWNADRSLLDYQSNSAELLYLWLLKKIDEAEPKLDQFSSPADIAEKAASLKTSLAATSQFAVPTACSPKFDATKQEVVIENDFDEGGDWHNSFYYKPGSPVPAYARFALKLETQGGSSRDYVGQNIYGATVTVHSSSVDTFRVLFKPVPFSGDGVTFVNTMGDDEIMTQSHVRFAIPMVSSEAREMLNQIGCMTVITLTPPYNSETRYDSSASLDFGIEAHVSQHNFVGQIDKIFVYNKTSGETYATATADVQK